MVMGQVNRQVMGLGQYEAAYRSRLRSWEEEKFSQRLWQRDTSLWAKTPVPELADRLGWLTLPERMAGSVKEVQAFAQEVRRKGFHYVILLGMGGSSLAPEVFQAVFGTSPGYPQLLVLDTTHPQAISNIERRIQLDHTLFLVSSKSGTTLETLTLFRYFWELATGRPDPARQFVAITDPGSALDELARERHFRRVWLVSPEVGGRYSALSGFGLVPAALIGVDVSLVLARARVMVEACASSVPPADNPCLQLGAALGELALAGRDKVTLVTSPAIAAFGAWVEQLLAESTGKDGKGIVPVVGETLGQQDLYGDDRVFVHLELVGDKGADVEASMDGLERSGYPVVHIRLEEKADLGQEFFRWEVATAAAGAILGIHPFNQPDVQLAKELADQWMSDYTAGKALPQVTGIHVTDKDLTVHLKKWLEQVRPGDYLNLSSYLAPTAATTAALQSIRTLIRDRLRIATAIGYGPRFLHSTGQLHKGGPNTGLFIQITDEPEEDIPVPGERYTFGTLLKVQALGDYQALKQKGRRVLRLYLGKAPVQGLKQVLNALG